MINNEKRREVAESLWRQLRYMRKNVSYSEDADVVECGNSAYRNIADAVERGSNFEKGNYVYIVEQLADLIDRPTCKNLATKQADELLCSECGEHVDIAYIESADDYHARYCPNCGAEVIHDA